MEPLLNFSYEPLLETRIRLFRIVPSSTRNGLTIELRSNMPYGDDQPSDDTSCLMQPLVPYAALSYRWGDLQKDRAVTVNGSSLPVTTSLHDALGAIYRRHLRDCPLGLRRPSRWLWADAICINQADGQEKIHQVRQMWQIYSAATEVLVWLGQASFNTASAIKALTTITSCPTSNRTPRNTRRTEYWCDTEDHPFFCDATLDGILDLACRPYFTRSWIVQEYCQGKKVTLLCGSFNIDNESLYHAVAVHYGPTSTWFKNEQHKWFMRIHKSWAEIGEIGEDLEDVFLLYFESECTDRRDKVFAMLGHPGLRSSRSRVPMLDVEYDLSADELLLCLLEWYDKKLSSKEFLPIWAWTSDIDAAIEAIWELVLPLCESLGISRTKEWVKLIRGITTQDLPELATLQNGRAVACNGIVLKTVTFCLHGVKCTPTDLPNYYGY